MTRPWADNGLQAEYGWAAWDVPTAPSRTRRLPRPLGFLGFGLGVAIVVAAWWLFAPAQLGGSTAFTTVDGTSMLPTFQRSDLVALRTAKSYHVGDIAGYRSVLLGRVVLHRIVAIDNGRYSFKGDHNSFRDPERPTRAQLVGKLWFRIPRAGRAVGALHTPWVVAVVAGLLFVALFGGTSARRDDGSA